jgi:hypothetical protein
LSRGIDPIPGGTSCFMEWVGLVKHKFVSNLWRSIPTGGLDFSVV